MPRLCCTYGSSTAIGYDDESSILSEVIAAELQQFSLRRLAHYRASSIAWFVY
jgi:hypothetical protein